MNSQFVPTEHQRRARSRVEGVLRAHEIEPTFEWIGDDPPWLSTEFSSPVRGPLEIHIRVDQVVMFGGPRIFEVYDRRVEYGEPSEVEEFARLLDRYLSGGEWYEYLGPVAWAKRLFGRG